MREVRFVARVDALAGAAAPDSERLAAKDAHVGPHARLFRGFRRFGVLAKQAMMLESHQGPLNSARARIAFMSCRPNVTEAPSGGGENGSYRSSRQRKKS